MRTRMQRWGALGGAVSLALTFAACGSNEKASAPEGSNVATASPVKFGIMSQTAGSFAQEVAGFGRDAALHYINNELGGFNGHKLELSVCADDMTPENAVSCGSKWVEEGVPVVLDTYSGGIGGAVPALQEAGIPYAGTVSGNTSVEQNDGAYYFTGPLALTAAGIVSMFQHLDVKTAAFVATDMPTAHAYIDGALQPMAKRAGVNLEVIWVDPATTDFQTAAATVMKNSPDLVGNAGLSEDACTALISSLRTQNFDKTIYGGSCSHFAEELPPEQVAGVTIIPRTWLPQSASHAPAETQKELQAFHDSMKAIGHEDVTSSRAVYAFTSLLTLHQILEKAGVTEFTAATIDKALSNVKDQPSFLGPEMTCDGKQFPNSPSACSAKGIYFTIQEDGSYKPGNPEGFFTLDLKTLLGL